MGAAFPEKARSGAAGARSRLNITAIQTRTGNPPVRLIDSPQDIGTLRRRAGLLLDRRRTGPVPINAYLIEHPEGLLLVDTGDTARKSDRGYMPRLNPYFRYTIDIRVAPEEEVGPQLNALRIRSSDLRAVIMTHLHHEHTGGLGHFPHTRILASAENLRFARHARAGRRRSTELADLVRPRAAGLLGAAGWAVRPLRAADPRRLHPRRRDARPYDRARLDRGAR